MGRFKSCEPGCALCGEIMTPHRATANTAAMSAETPHHIGWGVFGLGGYPRSYSPDVIVGVAWSLLARRYFPRRVMGIYGK